MTRAKGRSGTRNIRKKKGRSRKPNIAKLVYQYLRLGPQPAESEPNNVWSQSRKRRKEVRNFLHSRVTNAKNPVNQQRNMSKDCEAPRTVKQEEFPKENCYSFEGVDDVKRYIQKAINFGVDASYLIPVDDSGRIVRVSSDLLSGGSYLKDTEGIVSQDKENNPEGTPVKWADSDVQDARRRRSRRKRRRSRSRRRGSRRRKRSRRRSRSDNADYEVVEEDDYDFDNQPEKKKSTTENTGKEKRNERSNESDGEKTIVQKEEDGSDLSLDDDESDEDEKKGDDANKS